MSVMLILLLLFAAPVWAAQDCDPSELCFDNSNTVASATVLNLSATEEAYCEMIFGSVKSEVGKLTWCDGVFKFEGKVDESAQIFVDWLNSMGVLAASGK